ncbi:hypothetical protein [Millionella massiliensis]|uniref:hypothetical protein n=1 Tax=Millionella massiliensis TaxID=1871023 RepID=UPI0023A7ECD8|nr:hypothetical protein [Millionella massiliensis]
MGYKRSFTKRIAVHYSGSVSYPASQNGGSVSYSGTAYEDVTVNINVATEPFDDSVSHCNSQVGLLTGAVVATESAQVASIRKNARKVGQTVIDGFFKTVRYEISQQISELSSLIDATLMHLHELAKRCVDKQAQMETDYNRISARYLKIFDELNNELKNRIYELDRPAFTFKNDGDRSAARFIGESPAAATVVAGREEGSLQAMILASVVKKKAKETIREINDFLAKQKRLERILHQCILRENRAAQVFLPVCYVETSGEHDRIDRELFQSNYMPPVRLNQLEDRLRAAEWTELSSVRAGHIQQFFNRELSTRYATADPHATRVRDYITRLFNNATIKSI